MEFHLHDQQFFIRPFHHQDADLVYSYFQQLSISTQTLFHPHDFTREVAEQLTGPDLADAHTFRFLVGVRSDNQESMVGYFFFWDWSKSVPWFGIAVADAYQGRGLGKKMMDFAAETAKAHGKGGILLTTHKTNMRGQALYKSCGYEIIGDSYSPKGEYLLIQRY